MTWESWVEVMCALGLSLLTYAVMLVQIGREETLEERRQREVNELERMYEG